MNCQDGYKKCILAVLTKLVAETVKDAELRIRLVGLGKFLGKLGPRHVGTARVDHIHNLQETKHRMTLWHRCNWYQIYTYELPALEQVVLDELASSDGDRIAHSTKLSKAQIARSHQNTEIGNNNSKTTNRAGGGGGGRLLARHRPRPRRGGGKKRRHSSLRRGTGGHRS